MIYIKLHNSLTVVSGEDDTAYTLIEKCCALQYDFFIRRKGSPRAQRKSRELNYFSRRHPSFPSGWTGKIVKELQHRECAYEIIDERVVPPKIDLQILALPNDPWQHQEEALRAIQQNERGIVRVPTRGGKTLIMALTIASFNVPTVVMVPSKTLLEQEYEVFAQVFGEKKVGRLGGGHLDYHKDIIVATIQTLSSRQDDFFTIWRIFRRVGCVLFDECHHVGHGGYKLRNTYFEVAQRCNGAYYRIGFTATPGKTSSLERQLLTGVAGRLIYSVDIEELTQRKILTPARVDFVVIDRPHTPTLKEILQDVHGISAPGRTDVESLFRRNRIPIPHVPTFQEQLAEKITDDADFRRLVKTLAEFYAREGRSVIVLVSLVQRGVLAFTEGEFAITGAVGLSGQDTGREEVLEQFRNGHFSVLVSTLIKEGVDIPRADVLLLASCDVMDATPVLQRAGRVLTASPGKAQALVVDFYIRDQGTLERHSKARMKLYDQNSFDLNLLGAEELERMRC